VRNWLDPELLAQETHGAIGFGFFVAAYYRLLPFGLTWFLLAIALFLVVVFAKEAFWDPRHEVGQPFYPEGAFDFVIYLVGIAGAIVVVFV
jgi:hypothetical protein